MRAATPAAWRQFRSRRSRPQAGRSVDPRNLREERAAPTGAARCLFVGAARTSVRVPRAASADSPGRVAADGTASLSRDAASSREVSAGRATPYSNVLQESTPVGVSVPWIVLNEPVAGLFDDRERELEAQGDVGGQPAPCARLGDGRQRRLHLPFRHIQ